MELVLQALHDTVPIMKETETPHTIMSCRGSQCSSQILGCYFSYKYSGVQGTCKYGTRMDYILASSNSLDKFVPSAYSVFSSKGTSDHHIVKVDMLKGESNAQQYGSRKSRQPKQRIVKITNSSSKDLWKTYGEIDRKIDRSLFSLLKNYSVLFGARLRISCS
ncbi:unnamed protein product [Camellia sinensis]